MRFLTKTKDGGPDSPVDGYFLIEIKGLFSIVLLKFNKGRRDVYHSHAFNALTWFLRGDMLEEISEEVGCRTWLRFIPYRRSFIPKVTKRDRLHRVEAHRDSWCLSLRGPWTDQWKEFDPIKKEFITLTHNRKIIN